MPNITKWEITWHEARVGFETLIWEKEPWRFCAGAELHPWFFICQEKLRARKDQNKI
ncbi:hypothetical protein hamaS1_17210 [Moorella sp. Hama-1]|nr:hypothetical protein hamaS1_17210 [Moorella sp. Hama-1]